MQPQQKTIATTLAPYRLVILAGIFCILWSSAFSAAKIALEFCPPLLLLTARFFLTATVMLLLAAAFGQKLPPRRDLMLLGLLGIINYALFLGLGYAAMGSIPAGLGTLICSANPILTALAATAVLGERLTLRKAAGLALGFSGVVFIVHARLSDGTDSAAGVALMTGALVALVTGTLLFKLFAPQGGLWIGNGLQNLAGGLAVAPFAFGFESIDRIAPNWSLLIAFVYLALFASTIGLYVWFYLLTVAGATAASSYHFFTPPLGVLFGWLLLGERIGVSDMLGIVPVAYGIYLVTRVDDPRPVTADKAKQQLCTQ